MELPFAMFLLGSVGVPEALFIILIAVLVFGGKRLGDIGKGMGEAIRNFRTAVKDDKQGDGDKPAKPSS